MSQRMLLVLIMGAAILLRLLWLGSWPADGLNQDEAMRGYDAYSLVRTGKDHRGNPWPLYFVGFSDRRDHYTPFYIYSVVPSVALFGLNTFAVRFPAAVMGIVNVLFTYLLAKELFKKRSVAFLAAALLAVSPWHIFLSRFGNEYITVPFLTTIALWCFIRGIRGSRGLLIAAGALFGVTLYAYSTVKVFIPALLILLVVLYWRELLRERAWACGALAVFLMITFPLVVTQLIRWEEIQGRFNEISIFTASGVWWPARFLLQYVRHILVLIFFTPLEIVAILVGIGVLLGKHTAEFLDIQTRRLLIAWLAVGPLAASLTVTSPHVFRSAALLPLLSLIAAVGLALLVRTACRYMSRSWVVGVVTATVVMSGVVALGGQFYFFRFFYHYGWNHVVAYVSAHGDAPRVRITTRANQPHIFLLFYTRYDPAKFQSTEVTREYLSTGWQRVTAFDRYEFCDFNTCFDPSQSALYIARTEEIPGVAGEIIWRNRFGDAVFKAIETNSEISR